MDFKTSRFHRPGALLAVLALTICTGLLHATNSYLTLAVPNSQTGGTSAIPLTCNAASGLGPSASVIVSSTSATSSTNVTVAIVSVAVTVDSTTTTYTGTTGVTALANSPVQITAPNSQVLASSSATLTYTLSLKSSVFSANACNGLSTLAPTTTAVVTFSSKLGSGGTVANDTATPGVTVTQTAPLTVSPSSVTVYCTYNGSTYASVFPPTVSIYGALGSTGVTITGETSNNSGWLTVNTATGSATASSPVTFTANAKTTGGTPCNNLTQGKSATGSLTVTPTTAYYNPVTVPVTLQVEYPTPLNAVTTLTMTYRKGGAAVTAAALISSSQTPAPYFSVDTTTLPSYLTVDNFNGTATSGGKTITFSSTSLADSLPPGTYTASIHIKVTFCADLVIPIKFTVSNAAPVLSVSEGKTRNFTWSVGQAIPAPVITVMSSDTPIAYTATPGAGIVTSVSPTTGLAYSFGSEINVTFDPTQFQSAAPGATLTGTVTVTGAGTSIVVTFNIVVNPGTGAATLTAISPSSLPTSVAGQVFTVYLYGTGFVASSDVTQKTFVGINTTGSTLVTDANFTTNVLNNSTILLTITVPASVDGNLPFAGGGTVNIGVCNPGGSTCNSAGGAAIKPLKIGSGPTISSVTSASTFIQPTAPALTTVAPYDMISIFGNNFCNSGGTGCGTDVMYGSPAASTLVYGTTLSPDNGTRNLQVSFYAHPYTNGATALASAPLLFATNTQINALVPGPALTPSIGSTVDMVVWFGTQASAPYQVNVAATDPGIFTVGADGTGDAAILATNWSLISSTNPAKVRTGASDTLQIYMTGLGKPDYVTASGTCALMADYLSALQGLQSSIATLDGAVMQPSLYLTASLTAPCLATPSAMSFGSVSATPSWAGWVSGAIAGLYQANVVLPSNPYAASGVAGTQFTDSTGTILSQIVAPTQIPVWVGAPNSQASQSNVTMWVAPALTMGSVAGCNNQAVADSTPFTCTIAAASGGSGTSPAYTYTTTPLTALGGLTWTSNTRTLAATPSSPTVGSYMVTVTAKDSTNTDTMVTTGSFNLNVAAVSPGLTLTGTNPTASISGTANSAVTTVTASGGTPTPAYTYSVGSTTPSTATITVGSASGVVSTTSATPPGTYHVVINATDNNGSPKTGSLDFYFPVALQVVSSTGASVSGIAQVSGTPATLTAPAATGILTFTKIAGPSWLTVPSGVVTLSGAVGQTAGTYSATIKVADAGTSSIGYINLSIHIN